jgi:hypothetical protein
MATRNVMAAEPYELLKYLNCFENDRRTYVADPVDPRRVIVANELLIRFNPKILPNVGSTIELIVPGPPVAQVSRDPKAGPDKSHLERQVSRIIVKVINKSIWGENLFLIQGFNIHKIDQILDAKTKHNQLMVLGFCPNIITLVNNGLRPGPQTAPPIRNSPDGTLTALPTRNSAEDGTQQHDPTRNSESGSFHPWYPDPTVPLTEYWLRKAKQHNSQNRTAPIVAILDTGIDFRYDWTLCHQPEPSCPLWFNENDFFREVSVLNDDNTVSTFPRIQKDLIGWNFVGTGSLLTPSQHSNPFDDDIFHKHGTRIAAIIAKQTNWNVRLMILKTQDFRGVGTIFDAFCAFDYLLAYKTMLIDKGVKDIPEMIINASWGYYGAQEPEFTWYIARLQELNIWFVNAAGNSSDFIDSFRVHELVENTETERYPACYGNRIIQPGTPTEPLVRDPAKSKVVTVTTVTTTYSGRDRDLTIAYKENYSEEFVRVGIGAGIDGAFPESLATNQAVIRGSSYATAYASALLARGDGLGPYPPNQVATLARPDGSRIPIGTTANVSTNVSFILTDIENEQEL